jgi:hypothetical protein
MQGKLGRKDGVTIRSVLIGLAFVPLNVYLVMQWETVWGAQYPTTMSIFYNAVFCLLLVSLLNLILSRILPRGALSQGELITIYVVLINSITVTSHDYTHSIFCTLGVARWFATPENEWSTIFWRYLPDWLTVNDEKVLRGFYEGESTFHTAQHIMGWIKPMIWWTVFLTVMVFIMICINVIVRKQWIEHEKLTYPLVQLPFEMTRRDNGGFWGNRLLWLGFGIAAGVDIINGLNVLYPVFPMVPIRYNLGEHFTERPWNSMGSFLIQVNPYAIGLAFPIPLDLLFSCWFFFLVWKAERVIGSAMGVNAPGYPFPDQQILGGYLGISVVALWMVRKPLRGIFRKVLGFRSDVDDSNEPMSYRMAAFGAILGLIFLTVLLYQAGMEVWFAVSFLVLYLAILFAFTRMRAELGPPLQGIHYSGPIQLTVAAVGSRHISPQTLTVAAPLWTFTKELRNVPMPFQLESFKLADRANMNTRRLWKVILISSFVTILITFWVFLQLNYKLGALKAWRGLVAYGAIERWVTRPSEPDKGFLVSAGIGFLVVLFNTVMRLRFLWWQLHPLGYPVAGYYHFEKLWFPFFISWIAKRTILRYGGIKAYRRAFPLFMGLVLGEFFMGSIWGIIGLLTGKHTYAFKSW